MSVSYLVLTPPGAAANDGKARFVADRFAWPAFLFPAIWLLFQRQWLAGAVVLALQLLLGYLSSLPHLVWAALLVELALRMLIALEGPSFAAGRLVATGWTLRAVVPADDAATAEIMYFHAAGPPEHSASPLPSLSGHRTGVKPNADRSGLDLFGAYGDR